MFKNYLTFLVALLATVIGVRAEELTLDFKSSWGSKIVRLNKDVTFKATTNIESTITISVNGDLLSTNADVTYTEGKYTFSAAGDYKIDAVATAGDQTVTKTIYLCLPGDSKPSALTSVPPMGATRNADGTVTFCLAAPEKESVLICGSWNGYRVTESECLMDYIDGPADGQGSYRYFVKTVSGVPVNEPVLYWYLVKDVNSSNVVSYKNIGDPYARLVLDPNNDKWISSEVYPNMPEYPTGEVSNVCIAVYQDNFGAYDWKVENFKGANQTDLVIYELLIRDFTGTEGKASGNGTVRSAIEKIPYLVELGINAVELLPINEFDGNLSWGYNPNFYFAIDKAYGTAQDYKEFIDICHQNGIAVILDVVFNQSAGLHPWYQMYKIDSNPFYNKEAPHAYSVLNDWKQEYPLVQQQWHDMLKYWMKEYKVDGFRFDLVKGLGDNSSYDGSGSIDNRTNRFNQSRVDRMKRLHDAMREVNPDAYFINELLGDTKEENDMAKDGELNWMNLNTPGCEYAMGWLSNSNLSGMYAPKASRTAGSTVAYLESHDEERLAYKQDMYGNTGVKGNKEVSMRRISSAAAQMLLVPGSHMIWMFSELGNAQSTKDASGGNNTGNKIVNWSLLDDPANASLHKRYQEMIHIRLANKDLFGSDASYTNMFSGSAFRYGTAKYGDKELYLFVNGALTEKSATASNLKSSGIDTANPDKYVVLSKSEGPEPVIDLANGVLTLSGGGYVVLATKNVESAVKEIETDAYPMSVYGDRGMLTVYNAQSAVEVYNMSGQKVAESRGDFSIALPSGVYIVRSAGRSIKVLVK